MSDGVIYETPGIPRVLFVGNIELAREIAAMLDGEAAVEDVRTVALALPALETRDFELVLLDLSASDEGLEVLVRFQAVKPETVALVLSSGEELETPLTALRYGAFGYLDRPYTPEKIRNAVRRAVQHYRLHQVMRRIEEEARRMVVSQEAQIKQMVQFLHSNYRAVLSVVSGIKQADASPYDESGKKTEAPQQPDNKPDPDRGGNA